MQISTNLKSLPPSYIREILAAATAPGMISLAGGLPGIDSFPMALMAQSFGELASRPELFQYGQTAGHPPLLEAVRWRYQIDSSLDSMVCTGSQQALDLVARAYLDPGDCVVMESPGYLGALQVFGLTGARIESVTQTTNGPDLQQLEKLFSENRVKIFYAVPDFHNPTGVCWSMETRKMVSGFCEKYGVVLVEDCPYRDIRFSGQTLPTVSSFNPETTIVLRSFSKIVAPGMRLGVASAKPDWIAPMLKVKQAADLHSNIPMQAVLSELLRHPDFNSHLNKVVQRYKSRYQALSNAIRALLEHCSFSAVQGGMFLWLQLPPGSDAMSIAENALHKKVAVVPGDVFFAGTKNISANAFLRLNFSNTEDNNFEIAVHRLADAIAI